MSIRLSYGRWLAHVIIAKKVVVRLRNRALSPPSVGLGLLTYNRRTRVWASYIINRYGMRIAR